MTKLEVIKSKMEMLIFKWKDVEVEKGSMTDLLRKVDRSRYRALKRDYDRESNLNEPLPASEYDVVTEAEKIFGIKAE